MYRRKSSKSKKGEGRICSRNKISDSSGITTSDRDSIQRGCEISPVPTGTDNNMNHLMDSEDDSAFVKTVVRNINLLQKLRRDLEHKYTLRWISEEQDVNVEDARSKLAGFSNELALIHKRVFNTPEGKLNSV